MLTARATRALLTLLALPGALLAGCSRDDGTANAAERSARTRPGAPALRAAAYAPARVANGASIVGTVSIDGDIPADSTIATTIDPELCGASVPDSSVVHDGRALGNAVVWLADVTSGRALPVERRTEIVNTSCRLDPRVQAVVAGTTINVRSDDRTPHPTRFTRVGGGDSGTVTIPLTSDGQVVPDEHLAKEPGLIAVTCARHPWTRGWIAVFPSPYFAVTDAHGSFRIDSVPPGTYTLMAWHERGVEQVSQKIEVGSGGATAKVSIRVGSRE